MAWAASATGFILYREYVRSVAPSATPTTRCCGTIASPDRIKSRLPRSAHHGNVAHGCLPCRLCATRQTERSSRRCLRCREPCGCPQVGARALDGADSRRMHGNDAVRNACMHAVMILHKADSALIQLAVHLHRADSALIFGFFVAPMP